MMCVQIESLRGTVKDANDRLEKERAQSGDIQKRMLQIVAAEQEDKRRIVRPASLLPTATYQFNVQRRAVQAFGICSARVARRPRTSRSC